MQSLPYSALKGVYIDIRVDDWPPWSFNDIVELQLEWNRVDSLNSPKSSLEIWSIKLNTDLMEHERSEDRSSFIAHTTKLRDCRTDIITGEQIILAKGVPWDARGKVIDDSDEGTDDYCDLFTGTSSADDYLWALIILRLHSFGYHLALFENGKILHISTPAS